LEHFNVTHFHIGPVVLHLTASSNLVAQNLAHFIKIALSCVVLLRAIRHDLIELRGAQVVSSVPICCLVHFAEVVIEALVGVFFRHLLRRLVHVFFLVDEENLVLWWERRSTLVELGPFGRVPHAVHHVCVHWLHQCPVASASRATLKGRYLGVYGAQLRGFTD